MAEIYTDLVRWMTVVNANFVKIKLDLVDQTNSSNVASRGDVSIEIRHRVTVLLEMAVLRG